MTTSFAQVNHEGLKNLLGATLECVPMQTTFSPRPKRNRTDGHLVKSMVIDEPLPISLDDSTFVFGRSPESADSVPPGSDEERSPRMKKILSSSSCQCKFCLGEFPPAPDHATWKEVLHCTFRVMSVYHAKQYFSMKTEIVPFIETHWTQMWGETKEQQANWQATVSMIMSKYTQIFKSGSQEMGAAGYWGLSSFDSRKIANELRAFQYSQPQNKKRNRNESRDSAPPSPKKQKKVEESSLLNVLASVAFECFSVEKTNPLAFVPIKEDAGVLSLKLKEEISQLKMDVFNLDQQIRQASEETAMIDELQKSLASIYNRVVPDGMVPNFIPLAV